MARREIVVFTDDVTGEEGPDVQTVLLVADGIAYEVDMSETTHAAYSAAIEPYRSAGRRIGRANSGGGVVRPITAAPTARTAPDKEQNRAIRAWWARNQGHDGLPPMVTFGRIPQDVLDAFQRHGGTKIKGAPDVEPGKEPRKAGTVGAEVKVSGAPAATFSEPEAAPVQDEVRPARKRAAAAEVKPAKRTRGAAVTSKAQAPAKRTGRRTATSG